MKNKFHATTGSRTASLKLGAARLHARITGRLNQASGNSSTVFPSAHNLYGSLWSPVRLDLLKTPLTRYRE